MDLEQVFLSDVHDELRRARQKHAPMNSHHEAYAVILEELDEYWQLVKDQRVRRDAAIIYLELKQVAAMCMRAALDVCLKDA